MKYPLDGTMIVDFTRTISGPFCTMILAELGAEVIKIEEPRMGDETRTWPPSLGNESGYFFSVNRSKKSVAVNLKDPRGKDIIASLVNKSDVIVENFTPGVMSRLGLDYPTLRGINPRIIYCSISAFGQTGPYKKKKAYDPIIQAMGGIMSVTGEIGGSPVKVGIPITDFLTALYSVIGIILALSERKESGKGQYLDLSMFESTISVLSFIAAFYIYEGKVPTPFGSSNPSRVPSANYMTKDKKFIHIVPSALQWKTFCDAIGIKEVGDSRDYNTNAKRIARREKIDQLIQEKILQKNIDDWVKIFDEKGITSGPVYTMEQIFHDPQVIARKIVEEMDHPRHGLIKTIGLPYGSCGFKSDIQGPAPLLGEHSEKILSDVLGYERERITRLLADGVIRSVC